MLERLDNIPWADLPHAYGPAADVPDLLRQLASTDAKARQQALTELYGNIWHQGTVYEASAYAVPFLIELLQEPTVQDKEYLCIFLADLADGASYWDVHQHVPFIQVAQKEQIASGEMARTIAKELEWVKATREAVLARILTYGELLSDTDERVRMAAAYLLGSLHEAASTVADFLYAAYTEEKDDSVRAAEILALGQLVPAEPRVADYLAEVLTSGKTRAIKATAALGLSRMEQPGVLPKETRTRAVALLNKIVEEPDEVAEVFNKLPGFEDEVETLCGEALARLSIA